MLSAGRPSWQQMTALVSLSASGVVTGLSFVPKTADITSPANMSMSLLALQQTNRSAPSSDAALRSAIVNVSNYYLRMARTRTPAEMEALIWQHASLDGADHGESCAAFASLMLELASQAVGQQSWVSGGTSYPWPVNGWADSRVDPNAASPEIVSMLQDAQAHRRWHPLGDGYTPQPGDWVLFNGHVEVVTRYAGGALSTIGGDSLPNLSVNAHEYSGSLSSNGVAGFVNNGLQTDASPATVTGKPAAQAAGLTASSPDAEAEIPGLPTSAKSGAAGHAAHSDHRPASQSGTAASAAPRNGAPQSGTVKSQTASSSIGPSSSTARSSQPTGSRAVSSADVPGATLSSVNAAAMSSVPGAAAIPGLSREGSRAAASQASGAATTRSRSAARTPAARAEPAHTGPSYSLAVPTTVTSEQDFISSVAPGAVAAQQQYGVPAAVTIAQAIEESAWGQSPLASNYHNLFGIKGTGPAGSNTQPTQEYEHGRLVTVMAPFRVYHDIAQSIADHGSLIAYSGYYERAMSVRDNPDQFAEALTGVYSTDSGYGAKLIAIMRQYDLYRYGGSAQTAGTTGDASTKAGSTAGARPATTARPAASPRPATTARPAASPRPATTARPAASPRPATTARPAARPTPAASSARTDTPAPATGRTPAANPATGGAAIPGVRGSGQPAAGGPAAASNATVPGVQTDAYARIPQATSATLTVAAQRVPEWATRSAQRTAARRSRVRPARYEPQIPGCVQTAIAATAKKSLIQHELLYQNVASMVGLPWEFLAACDWMQCEARSRYSPVNGEKLGTVNPDGTVYRTRSAALMQCGEDLVELASAVYQIDLTARYVLSVRDLADAFAAFRWGQLLVVHRTSAMEFPYSVAGLTARHLSMRWPAIDEPHSPDKPGTRFRRLFGAVPVVLSLDYPATV